MGRSSTLDRIQRLERLSSILKAGEPLVAETVAAELDVSRRTLFRDIALLREQGLPVETDRGRGGGIRLHRTWGVGRLVLNEREAIDLLVSLAIAEQMKSPVFMADLGSVRRKLLASFGPGIKVRVSRLKSRILVGEGASPVVLSGFDQPTQMVIGQLNDAFVFMNAIDIDYRDEAEATTRRMIEPHYILLNYPVWYLLSWDRMRSDVRTFRIDRVKRCTRLEDVFKLLPLPRFEPSIAGSDIVFP